MIVLLAMMNLVCTSKEKLFIFLDSASKAGKKAIAEKYFFCNLSLKL